MGPKTFGLIFAMVITTASPLNAQTLDELYKKALAEGGVVNFYSSLANINAAKILPQFEKRFPGIKINHVESTADQLATRAIAEMRGGKTIGDVFQSNLDSVVRLHKQGIFEPKLPPEAAAYPENLKGAFWMATDLVFLVPAWNSKMIKKDEEIAQFDDLADPRWKGRIIAEPRDFQILIGLAKHKFKNDDKAVALLRRIAANAPEFHKGHSQLAELLAAGQAAVCATCYSHHFPARIAKGATVGYMLSEGVGDLNSSAVFKNAPHPNAAWLMARWLASEEGQKVYAQGGRLPAHPKVDPTEKTKPLKIYPVGENEIDEFPKYEKMWKEIFQLR